MAKTKTFEDYNKQVIEIVSSDNPDYNEALKVAKRAKNKAVSDNDLQSIDDIIIEIKELIKTQEFTDETPDIPNLNSKETIDNNGAKREC